MARTCRKWLSVLLTLAMVLSMLPVSAMAADTGTFTAITSAGELTSGEYVMVVDTGVAPTVFSSNWVLADGTLDTSSGKVISPAEALVWTITKNSDGTVKLTDSNGVNIAPKGGNDNGIIAADYDWTVTCNDGTFRFGGQGDDTVVLASNKGFENKFRAYKTATVTGNPGGYPANFTLYKKDGGSVPVEPGVAKPTADPAAGEYPIGESIKVKFSSTTENANIYYRTDKVLDVNVGDWYKFSAPIEIDEDTLFTVRAEKDAVYSETAEFKYTFVESEEVSTIAEALAGSTGTEFTVEGVVTLLDGNNIYLQDATGGICVRMSSKPSDIALGDTIKGTGKRATYNGLPQLGSGTYEKASGVPLKAKAVSSISALTESDICTYVKLANLEVTKVDDNNGQYSSPNITVKDSNGDTIQIYKAVVGKTDGVWDVAVGDKVNVTAALGVFSKDGNTTLQLRNTLATEITPFVTPSGPLQVGDKVVIWNPANGKALSQVYNGFYNSGVDVAMDDGKLTGFSADEVWTVGADTEGNYTFATADGKLLSMGASYSSTPLDDVNVGWVLTAANTDGCYYVKNAVRGYCLEWYADKNNWSSYNKISAANEGLFAMSFYQVVGDIPDAGGLPKEGDQVVIYNAASKGVLAAQNDNTDSPSILGVSAIITANQATPANGGVIFTVEENGEYLRFKNEAYGYLCSNGTGNNAFYSKDAADDADWTLAEYNGGYTMESRTAKFNGKYSQFLEYYADSYKTYSMNKVTEDTKAIYTFHFYPVAADVQTTEGIVNMPAVNFGKLLDAYVGMNYTFSFTVDAVFGVETMEVKAGETVLTANDDGSYTIPAAQIAGEKLTITVSGADKKGVTFSGSADAAVKDEPVITNLTPAAGSETGENKRPVISADIANAGENPTVTLAVNGETVDAVYADGKVAYTPAADLADGRTAITVTVTRADGKTAAKTWSFTVGKAAYQKYFGQLHSHTQYSDGSGTLETALDYIRNLPDAANVDFTAFTDHSNYFDFTSSANPEGALYDMSLASADSQTMWKEYKDTVADFNNSQSDVIALGGFEMTWSGGPGHINTFNTPGIVSRNNKTLNNKTGDAGMQAYYALLSQPEGAESLSQFNHPGTTFGNFADFSYWDAVLDTRIQMLEVGNGEGQIGAGGYFPSYEQYTMALDKGWHVAPTNNQDNHKGKWGNANDARDVIITEDFSEQGLYDAIRAMRMYATEDKNLEIDYTVNGLLMGSSIKTDEIPEMLDLRVVVGDPDTSDSISKVEVIVNSGKVAHTWSDPAELASGELTAELAPDYSYYYIRVTEGDGDLAVTAPVWVGEPLKLGISKLECGTSTPVTDEELTLTTTLFNSETTDAAVKSISYAVKGGEVLDTDTTGYTIPASGTLGVEFKYTPAEARVLTVTVTAVVEQDGKEFTFTKDITLDVEDADRLVYIGIDASHYNEYVAGNYKDSMGNFSKLAAGYSVRTVELDTSADLITAAKNENGKFKALILTAPSRRLADAQSDPKTYTADELAAINAFNQAGGVVVLAGWSDNYENYPVIQGNPDIMHMAAAQNEILKALGSSLRIGDDATYDDVRSAADGVDPWRLYFSTYGDTFLTDGVEVDAEHPYDRMYTEVFSHYGGATVYTVDGTLPDTVKPVVYGHATTYSKDVDGDGLGGSDIPKYAYAEGDDRLLVMASEQLAGRGLIVVSGAAFMSNFEVQAQIGDSNAEKNYANYKICENLVQHLNPAQVTDIAEVQAQSAEGYKYTIEGVVTSNASGYDKNTAFFDCIYLQDDTAGINAFPVAGNFKVGDKVRITGTTSSYQGERQIAVSDITLLSEGNEVSPKEITAGNLNDGSVLGSLVTLKGTVVSYELANGLVQTILVKDSNGDVGRVFIDGYITTDEDVKDISKGCKITVTGLASYDDTFNAPEGPFPRIRVRNRADVVCTKPGSSGSSSSKPAAKPGLPFDDVAEGDWYYEDVEYVYENGFMEGVTDDTFAPDRELTRGMIVTILYRMAAEPDVAAEEIFTDVVSGRYYFDAVEWAAENGIANGYDDSTFKPDNTVTRQQLVAFLYRYAKEQGMDVTVSEDYLQGFNDASAVSAYAVPAMNWAVSKGILKGNENYLMPAETATRAQIAAILRRFQKN